MDNSHTKENGSFQEEWLLASEQQEQIQKEAKEAKKTIESEEKIKTEAACAQEDQAHQTQEPSRLQSIKAQEPAREQWLQLYEIAAKLKALAPWEFLWDADLIAVKLPGQAEPYYCAITGRLQRSYGIVVYLGTEGLKSFYRLTRADQKEAGEKVWLTQNCLTCYYGDREELKERDIKCIKQLGLKFRGKNNWVYFRSMQEGLFPWYIHSQQADTMIAVLENLLVACEMIQKEKIRIDFDKGETLLRSFSEEKEQWVNSVEKITSLIADKEPQPVIIEDELLIAKLRRHNKTSLQLEWEISYLFTPIVEKRGERPYFPVYILAADKVSGMVLAQQILDLNESAEAVMIELFAGLIQRMGRPASIDVQNERVSRYISDICKKLDIKLEMRKNLPTLDRIIKEMEAFMQ